MTIEGAIEHAREVANRGCTECHKEHGQLADWLEELVHLKSKRKIMNTPFENDPCAIVARAFKMISDKEYHAQIDTTQSDAFGETFFPDDGTPPIVTVFAHTRLQDAPEILAHELAHVAAGPGHGHDEVWEAWFKRIHEQYECISRELFCDEVEL